MEDPLVDSEILYSGEGRDVERWLEPRNKFFMFVIACLLISTLMLLFLLHILNIVYLFCYISCYLYLLLASLSSLHYIYHSLLSVYTHLNKKAIEYLNSSSREILEKF